MSTLASQDPRAATLLAQLTLVTTAIAAVQPEPSAPTASLVAVATLVTSTLATARALLNTLQSSTVPADATLYIWVLGVEGNLQAYLGSLQTFTGQDNSNSTIVIGGTTMFHLAAQYLNDWTRWVDIANVNNTPDPSIAVATAVAIPRN